MRSKKDKDTVVIATTDTRAELEKLLQGNKEGWEEIKIEKPELDGLLEGFPDPTNRAERRRLQFKKGT